MIKAIRITRDVFGQAAFDAYRGEELRPGRHLQTDEELEEFIRTNASPDYHRAGACKMDSDPMAVVDHQLRMHGLEGLRVADCAIMPRLIGGNTNMPAVMIGEKASDLVLDGVAK